MWDSKNKESVKGTRILIYCIPGVNAPLCSEAEPTILPFLKAAHQTA